MKNNYVGSRERILHAASVDEAETLFGSLLPSKGYSDAHIRRCKNALARCKQRLSKPAAKPAAESEQPADWTPGEKSKAKRAKK